MGSITDYLELELLDHALNNSAYASVATLYLCLCTADPTDAATGGAMNECANTGSYQRTAIAFGASASRKVTQSGAVTFPEATGAWGTVTHWAIADTQTHGAGNVLGHGAFATSKAIVSGNTPEVADTEVYVQYDAGYISNYLADKLMDEAFNDVAYTPPATYIAACTATISDSDTGSTITEPGGGAYARKLVNPNAGASPTWDLAAAGLVDNTHDILFTTATASWGTVVATGIVDAATVGNLLFYDNGTADQLVDDGDTYKYPAGDLDVAMA